MNNSVLTIILHSCGFELLQRCQSQDWQFKNLIRINDVKSEMCCLFLVNAFFFPIKTWICSHVHVCYAVVANEALPSSEFLFIYCVAFLLSHFFVFPWWIVLLKSKFSFQSLCYVKHNDSVTKSDALIFVIFTKQWLLCPHETFAFPKLCLSLKKIWLKANWWGSRASNVSFGGDLLSLLLINYWKTFK